jgi:hypothetical protein
MIRTLIKLFISDCDLRLIPLGISGILGSPAIEESMALTSSRRLFSSNTQGTPRRLRLRGVSVIVTLFAFKPA